MGNKLLIIIPFLMTLLLINSCASTGFLMSKPKMVMFAKAYPPKKMNESIDVYQTTMPDKGYIEIAKISCNDTSDKWNLKQILIKAREIGADGIIIMGTDKSYAGMVPVGKMMIAVKSDYGIVAIAIVYK